MGGNCHSKARALQSGPMRAHPCLPHRLSRPLSAVCVLLAAVLAGPSLAQTPQNSGQKSFPSRAVDEREQLTKKEHSLNQKGERIQVEDGGSRVDELRVGGQTQQITVQPKTGEVPAYEVQPHNSNPHNRSRSDTSDTNGPRVWNVLKF